MNLSSLTKITQRKTKRIGRGIGSGKGGHTSSRGQKGQKSREKVSMRFEGTKMKKSFLKKLPLLRGKGKFKPGKNKAVIINLDRLENWPVKLPVNAQNLVKQKLLADVPPGGIKILGGGNIKTALTIEAAISDFAKQKVIKAGGKIIEV